MRSMLPRLDIIRNTIENMINVFKGLFFGGMRLMTSTENVERAVGRMLADDDCDMGMGRS